MSIFIVRILKSLRQTRPRLKFAKNIFLIPLIFLFIYLLEIAILTLADFSKDLTRKETIMNRNNTGVILYDRNGRFLSKFFDARNREYVDLSHVPQDLQNAVLAAEDKSFFSHSGYSLRSTLAALFADLKRQKLEYGGSTITQQLVKNSLVGRRKNFLRKYQEILLAVEIERRYSKNEILEMYLNSIYFGRGAYGVGPAAEIFFDKKVSQLSLGESVLLASLPLAPSRLTRNTEDLKSRYLYVLNEMEQMGHLTASQKEDLALGRPEFKDYSQPSTEVVHFSLMVMENLIQRFGEEDISRSGFKIYTTLDLDWQKFAQDQLSQQVKALYFRRVNNGAVVVEDTQTGEIRALVGSSDWNEPLYGKVNMAVSPRQPGSAFKPIVYAAAFEKRLATPATVLPDSPLSLNLGNGKTYQPVNYDKTFRGPVLARRALANSLNVPSVNLFMKVGIPTTLEMAKRLGISNLKEAANYGPALVLGSAEIELLELTNTYATFANRGIRNNPSLFTKVENKYGEVVLNSEPSPNKVLDEEVSFLISSILSDEKARAEVFGSALNINFPAAVKTGTTTDFRDSWTVGYTPSLAIGVWLGNNDNSPLDRVAGSLGAAPVWKSLMEKFLEKNSKEKFEPPDSVVKISICRFNGLPYRNREATSSTIPEFFLKGTEPKGTCQLGPAPPMVAAPLGR